MFHMTEPSNFASAAPGKNPRDKYLDLSDADRAKLEAIQAELTDEETKRNAARAETNGEG